MCRSTRNHHPEYFEEEDGHEWDDQERHGRSSRPARRGRADKEPRSSRREARSSRRDDSERGSARHQTNKRKDWSATEAQLRPADARLLVASAAHHGTVVVTLLTARAGLRTRRSSSIAPRDVSSVPADKIRKRSFRKS